MKLDFWVTISLGYHRSGDMEVTVDVSDREYELLKQCCREYGDIDSYKGLESLYARVVAEAKAESEACAPEDEDEIDYDDASYTVAIPDKIEDEVRKED